MSGDGECRVLSRRRAGQRWNGQDKQGGGARGARVAQGGAVAKRDERVGRVQTLAHRSYMTLLFRPAHRRGGLGLWHSVGALSFHGFKLSTCPQLVRPATLLTRCVSQSVNHLGNRAHTHTLPENPAVT